MTKSSSDRSYAGLQTELTEVMSKLQAEDIDIDQAIELHKQASTLITQLGEYLKQAKLTITKLTADKE